MNDRPKTCATCAHRNGSMKFGICMKSGFFLTSERKYPINCDKDFSGWVLREGFATRLWKAIK